MNNKRFGGQTGCQQILSKCVREDKNKTDTVQRIYTRACGIACSFYLLHQTARHSGIKVLIKNL
jgi:hypothetical protein